jgi:hypothetical protein
MGIRYDASARRWVVENENTNYKTDYPVDFLFNRPTDYVTNLKTDNAVPDFLPVNLPINLSTTLKTDNKTDYPTNLTRRETYTERVCSGFWPFRKCRNIDREHWVDDTEKNAENARLNETNTNLNRTNAEDNVKNVEINRANYETNLNNANENLRIQEVRETNTRLNNENANTNATNTILNSKNTQLNNEAIALNAKNQSLNQENTQLNRENTAANNLYSKTVALASTTKGGDYILQRDQINYDGLVAAGMNPAAAQQIVDNIKPQFKLFYQKEKLVPWDTSLGAAPPYGTFDPKYYKDQNLTVNTAWNQAVAQDDIDITERYGENNFYWQHYTSTGKAQGLRGNKEEDLIAAQKYIEQTPTDKDIQDIRDFQLGVDTDTITQRLLNVPEVSNEWTKARQGDSYWKKLAKEKYLDVTKPEEFAVLFRLSERPEDKQIILSYNINAGSGITELEDAINTAINTKKTVEVKKFAAINQTILKDAITEMKKQKGRQEMMSFFRGFSGFTEVMDVNKDLTNAILGDTGVGGVLSFTSGGKGEEDLLNALQNVTGMRNNITYNWQQWFDKSIKEKYGIDYSMFEPLEEKKDIINYLNK